MRKFNTLLLVQAVESSKQAGTGDWSSRFRSFLVHSAQLTHLDSLLASTSQPATVVPQPVGMAPFLDISSSPSKQVSMLKAWTACCLQGFCELCAIICGARNTYLQAMQGFCCVMLPCAAATASCSHCQHCCSFVVASAWPALLLASKLLHVF